MGLGRDAGGAWAASEDFRWPGALKGFLDFLSQRGNHAVDLVIAGDLFELWQPPQQVKCVGASAELGCTVDEMVTIAKAVVSAHAQEMGLLAEFAERGDNRVHLIPGNHDAALLLEPVWQQFAGPLRAEKGRVLLVQSGVWVSADGLVVVEHGHQIGADVNRYEDWPKPPVRSERDKTYVVRPWGERFVQVVFNEQEAQYPIIDNLSPEAAGVRYRMADRGVWGSLEDLARFIAFNLFETSAAQKTALLGAPKGEPEEKKWHLSVARKSGHRLFVAALAPSDPFRKELMANDQQAAALRKELDLLAANEKRLTDGAVRSLCDLAAANSKDGWVLCRPANLGALVQGAVVPLSWQLREHLATRLAEFTHMRVFIYGHTHAMQVPWRLAVNSSTGVVVANSGAFQRLVDEEGFIALIKSRSWSAAEGLRHLRPDDLPPCYGVILVPYESARPVPKAHAWWMSEDAAAGELVGPRDSRCR
jgi:UDP-2,3-diacylglucosamine pyrophosphatase LpxH